MSSVDMMVASALQQELNHINIIRNQEASPDKLASISHVEYYLKERLKELSSNDL